jgi:hypothetical protein
MRVGDIVVAGKHTFRISGVYLGGVGTENLVGLISISLNPGAANGETIDEMLVPEALVLTAEGVYRRID